MDNKSSFIKQALPQVTLGDVFVELASGSSANWVSSVVMGVSEDSRDISKGCIFVARDGEFFKGSDYIDKAINLGAIAVLIEKVDDEIVDVDVSNYGVPVFSIKDLAFNVGKIAAKVFGNVISKLNVIGITGTNGKTSCAHYIAQALNALGQSTFMIGTLGNGHPEQLVQASRTTPDACKLHSLFASYYEQGACNVVMEVSSHALEQGRVEGIPFVIAAYTNLSRDHLDYHGTMQSYAQAKNRLFTDFSVKHRILNFDDEYNRRLFCQLQLNSTETKQEHKMSMTTLYSESADNLAQVDMVAKNIKLQQGLAFVVKTAHQENEQEFTIETSLIGKFNIANLLLVSAVLLKMGCTKQKIQQALKNLTSVPGRMQSVSLTRSIKEGLSEEISDDQILQPLCVVDYAHTPDALEKALQASRIHCANRLIVVFGCGGDRDSGKRAEMAKVAEQFADVIIVTNDNPRTENPNTIITMVEKGFSSTAEFLTIEDRKQAIFKAIKIADDQDVVLIAGKGHENYQEIMGVRHDFSDANVVMEALLINESNKKNIVGIKRNNMEGKL